MCRDFSSLGGKRLGTAESGFVYKDMDLIGKEVSHVNVFFR